MNTQKLKSTILKNPIFGFRQSTVNPGLNKSGTVFTTSTTTTTTTGITTTSVAC